MKRFVLCAVALLSVSGCLSEGTGPKSRDAAAKEAAASSFTAPRVRWEERPRGSAWTEATLNALQTHGAVLPSLVPSDIDNWCPAYREAGGAQRRAFWAGLLSALSKHESTYRADAVGGGGRWFGLMQISPATARHYGCRATSGAELKTGVDNLSCAVRIMAVTVPRDGVIAANGRGIAADWGPMNVASKRHEMQSWVSRQRYCRVQTSG